MEKVTKVWTTREGERIRICDMSNNHLINSIKMLERQTERVWGLKIRDVMKLYHYEDYINPYYWDLIREAKNRGLSDKRLGRRSYKE